MNFQVFSFESVVLPEAECNWKDGRRKEGRRKGGRKQGRKEGWKEGKTEGKNYTLKDGRFLYILLCVVL